MLHAITGDGILHHRDFLADGADDPRQFSETLIEGLAAFDGQIVVYSGYEQTRLRDLAGQFPELREALNAIIARLLDLLPIVRGAVNFTEFCFSNSIKAVAPALSPDFGYDDLGDIADGAAASAAFLQLASPFARLRRQRSCPILWPTACFGVDQMGGFNGPGFGASHRRRT